MPTSPPPLFSCGISPDGTVYWGSPYMVKSGTSTLANITIGGVQPGSIAAADTAIQALFPDPNGGNGTVSATIFVQTATATLSNNNVKTSLWGTGIGGRLLPANFWTPGKTIQYKLAGVYSTPFVPGTLLVGLEMGGVSIASVNINNMSSSQTNVTFNIVGSLTCRTSGASGTIYSDGMYAYENGALLGSRGSGNLNKAGAATTIDTTAAGLFDIVGTIQTANTGNSFSSIIGHCVVLNYA